MVSKIILVAVSCLLLLSMNIVFAKNEIFTEFFASNNTSEINIKTAYARLIGIEQSNLKKRMIIIFHKNHVERGKFENILGVYRSSINNTATADNTECFNVSAHQKLSDKRIFSIARQLAITLKQESVAVFIPNHSDVGKVTLDFVYHKPRIDEVFVILHDKLPLVDQGFSLHLAKANDRFRNAKITEIEWLGSKINLETIKKAFPHELLHYSYGSAFLVCKNGNIIHI